MLIRNCCHCRCYCYCRYSCYFCSYCCFLGFNPADRLVLRQAMPPRSSLTSSFPTSDASNEVVCPLVNHDGSNCRKRCLGVSPLTPICAHPMACSLLRPRSSGDGQLNTRKNATAPCKSIYEEHIQITTYPSFLLPKRASNS